MSGGRGKRKCKKRFFWAIKAGCRGFPTVASWCGPWGVGQGEAGGHGAVTLMLGSRPRARGWKGLKSAGAWSRPAQHVQGQRVEVAGRQCTEKGHRLPRAWVGAEQG